MKKHSPGSCCAALYWVNHDSDWDEHKLVCGYVFGTYVQAGLLMERISLPKTMAKKAKLEDVNRHVDRLAFVPQNA